MRGIEGFILNMLHIQYSTAGTRFKFGFSGKFHFSID